MRMTKKERRTIQIVRAAFGLIPLEVALGLPAPKETPMQFDEGKYRAIVLRHIRQTAKGK